MRKIVLSTLVASGMLFSGVAMADETTTTETNDSNQFSLHLQLSAAGNTNPPQSQIYTVGPALAVKPMFNVLPWLGVGPVVQAYYFPRLTDNGQNAGLLWQAGGGVRVQGSRTDFDGTGLFGGLSPWLGVDLVAEDTGKLARPGFNVDLGLEGALDDDHAAWLGMFVGYNHTFQTANTEDGIALSRQDVNIFQGGVSLSFDFPPRHLTTTRTHNVRYTTFVPIEKSCPPVVKPATLQVVETVYFDWDKSALRWESKDKLDRLVNLLKANPSYTFRVSGHASLDGQYDHNTVLAQHRTDAVVAYLTAHGVSADRLAPESHSSDVPAFKGDNNTQEGRERNRRVQFQAQLQVVSGK